MMLVKIASVHPPKFKLRDDIGQLDELKASIKEHGILNPIVVRAISGNTYEVIAGHRRYVSALELFGSDGEIPVTVVEVDDKTCFEMALIENIQRNQMDVIEEGQAFNLYLHDCGFGGITELAKKIGKSPSYVQHRLSLISLPKETFQAVKTGAISASHGEALSRLDSDTAEKLTELITTQGTGRPYLDANETAKVVDLVHRGQHYEQAVSNIINHPEMYESLKEHERYDPVKVARDTMVLGARKLLIDYDSNISILADGEEKQKWIQIRYEVHQLLDKVMKLQKEYQK